MSIINQYDKRSGITYVYESVPYWDKEKEQSLAKRKLIGKRDPETGEIIPLTVGKNDAMKISPNLPSLQSSDRFPVS